MHATLLLCRMTAVCVTYIGVLCCMQGIQVDSSSCEEDDNKVYNDQLSEQVVPEYKYPAEEDIASSSEEELDDKEGLQV